ncbi:hypothetical protein [Amycolatopsis sp. NBRC 101858]|uniref:hypothetical protein n=1 Tax=Amycolatopsis sp. NBRC 101858 TaxID=3032200 RepID=UPI0025564032|nr:hypothetical protein [Amycolatopsis sp. NBRC 101858]
MTTAPPAEQAWLLRLGELRFRVFSGAPVVEVSPAQWGLDDRAVRQAAAGRRYRETPPGQAGFLRFEFAPGSFPPHFDRGPGTDADRRRLGKLLAGQEQFWASTRRLRLGRADVGAVAAAAGMTVVAEAADPTDRLLLLRRSGLPDEELRSRTRQRITRAQVWAGVGGLFAACAVAALVWGRLTDRALGPLLLVFGAAASLLVTGVAMRVVAGRSPRLPWLDAQFDGRSHAAVPYPVSLSTELLAEVASRYGYFYGGPVTTGRNETSHLFVKCRPGLVFGTPALPGPPGFEPPAGSPEREQWLRNHLDGRDELWISVRHAKLPPARIAEIAGGEGLSALAHFADPTDLILLLRRPSAPPRAPRKFRMSFAGFLVPAAWALLCFGGGAVTAVLDGDEHLFAVGAFLAVLGVPPLLWVLRVFPRSTRVGWLAGEFTGKAGVTFFSGQFDVSPELERRIAGYHGYAFRSETHTQAQGRLVTYVRYR